MNDVNSSFEWRINERLSVEKNNVRFDGVLRAFKNRRAISLETFYRESRHAIKFPTQFSKIKMSNRRQISKMKLPIEHAI